MKHKFICLIALLACTSAFAGDEDIPNRFASLKIKDGELLYKNHPMTPALHGNDSLTAVGTYQIANSDVILLQDNGGSGCPAMFYFITVSSTGIKAVGEFGTCSPVVQVKKTSDTIIVNMSEFMGDMERDAGSHRRMDKETFIFKNGVVTQNGVPVKLIKGY